MKQSNNKKSRDVTAFLYERLSRDDNLEGESYSIGNQKKLLTKVAKEKGYTNLVHFLDDGISGVTMDRPGFVDMIRQLEEGRAAAVFVKDLSRLGRNYIEVGRLTEEFFPEHDIRLVAVSDNIDTAEGENEMAPIRNLFNEWYARDISKKRRISNKIKGNAGEPMGQPPYGYMKDPDNPKRWIVDDEAALVVKRIYSMTLDGLGTEQIAAQLERDGILTPRAYWLQKGVKRPGKGKQLPPTRWNSSTITKILSLQEYCGDILNFKTYSKSYKNKKRIDRPATFFGRRKAIEALQESSLGLANAHADMMDALALSFADQRKIGEILNQMLLICVSNLAGTRSLIGQLEAGLRTVEKGDYSEETKQEMKRIIRDLKAQEDLMIRQEKQAEALRKYGTQLQAAEDHLHEQDERHAETVEEVARANELAVSNRKKLDEIRGKMQATEDAFAESRKRQNVLFCTVVVLILITIIQFLI